MVWLYVWLTLSLMIVAPVTPGIVHQWSMLTGFIPVNLYHNPTVITMLPYAFILAVIVPYIFLQPVRSRIWVISSAIAVMLSLIAKPNYGLALLPALGIFAVRQLILRRPVDWRWLILGVFLPGIFVLAAQYILAFLQDADRGSGIIVQPFLFVLSSNDLAGWTIVVIKFFLSVLFPLSVLTLYFDAVRKDLRLVLAYITFGVAAGMFYLLAESGVRQPDRNFTWGIMTTLLIIFVFSVAIFMRETNFQFTSWRSRVCGAIYGLHVVSGLGWFFFTFTGSI